MNTSKQTAPSTTAVNNTPENLPAHAGATPEDQACAGIITQAQVPGLSRGYDRILLEAYDEVFRFERMVLCRVRVAVFSKSAVLEIIDAAIPSLFSRKQRRRLFRLMDRWVDRLFANAAARAGINFSAARTVQILPNVALFFERLVNQAPGVPANNRP